MPDDRARIELETDGTYHGTVLKINGEPVHNCSGLKFEISADTMMAVATVELDCVPITFSADLERETA